MYIVIKHFSQINMNNGFVWLNLIALKYEKGVE